MLWSVKKKVIQAHEWHKLRFRQHLPKVNRCWDHRSYIKNNYHLCATGKFYSLLMSFVISQFVHFVYNALPSSTTYTRQLSRVRKTTPTFFCFCYDMSTSNGKWLTFDWQYIYTYNLYNSYKHSAVCFEIWNIFLSKHKLVWFCSSVFFIQVPAN
jgi:hypothetical protein